MIKIRLARGGAKKRPYYSIVVADSHSPRDGRFIEKVGTFNPLLNKDDPQRVTLKVERLKDWIGKGAQPTDRVARFLAVEGLAKWEHGSNPKKGLPGKKALERAAEREEAANRPPPPAPEPVEEVAAEEPVAEAPAAEPVEAEAVEAEAPAAEEAEAVEAEAAQETAAEAAEDTVAEAEEAAVGEAEEAAAEAEEAAAEAGDAAE